MQPFKANRSQKSFFDSQIYDRLIPRDHILVRLNHTIDFSFVEEECRQYYSLMGRRGENPVILYKMLLLSFMFDLSERSIEEHCNLNLAFKYFLGLEVDDKVPDHSTLSKFRNRIGADGFAAIFNRIVEIARQKGLVSDKLRIVDSTHIQANVDIFKSMKRRDGDDEEPGNGLPGSPDKDARFGAKSKKKKFFGYKHHIGIDPENDIITNSATSPGHLDDKDYLMDMVTDVPPEALTADKLYDSAYDHDQLEDLGVKSFIIRKKTSKAPDDPDYPAACKIRKRVERVFAVHKKYQGGGKARYWGLAKTAVQDLLISAVYDLRIITNCLCPPGVVCPIV